MAFSVSHSQLSVKFVTKSFILFHVVINGIVLLISFSGCSFLSVYRHNRFFYVQVIFDLKMFPVHWVETRKSEIVETLGAKRERWMMAPSLLWYGTLMGPLSFGVLSYPIEASSRKFIRLPWVVAVFCDRFENGLWTQCCQVQEQELHPCVWVAQGLKIIVMELEHNVGWRQRRMSSFCRDMR